MLDSGHSVYLQSPRSVQGLQAKRVIGIHLDINMQEQVMSEKTATDFCMKEQVCVWSYFLLCVLHNRLIGVVECKMASKREHRKVQSYSRPHSMWN